MEILVWTVWGFFLWGFDLVITLASIWPVSILCAGVKRLLVPDGNFNTPAYAIAVTSTRPYDGGLF
jgi:hypothetical protein